MSHSQFVQIQELLLRIIAQLEPGSGASPDGFGPEFRQMLDDLEGAIQVRLAPARAGEDVPAELIFIQSLIARARAGYALALARADVGRHDNVEELRAALHTLDRIDPDGDVRVDGARVVFALGVDPDTWIAGMAGTPPEITGERDGAPTAIEHWRAPESLAPPPDRTSGAAYSGGFAIIGPMGGDDASAEGVVPTLGRLIRAADAFLALLPSSPGTMEPALSDAARAAQDLRERAYTALADANPDQAWYWTEEWQRGERGADADKEAGRSTQFESDADFVAALKAMRPDIAYS